jgi:hypothetical protein
MVLGDLDEVLDISSCFLFAEDTDNQHACPPTFGLRNVIRFYNDIWVFFIAALG